MARRNNRDYDRYSNQEYDRSSRRSGSQRNMNRGDYNRKNDRDVYTGGYPGDFGGSFEDESYFGGGSSGPGYGGGYDSSDVDYGGGYSGGRSDTSRRGSSYSGRYDRNDSDYDRNSQRGSDFESSFRPNTNIYDRDENYGSSSSYRDRDYYRQNRNYGSARSDYGDRAYGGRLNNQGMSEDRGWWDKATDEVSSWMGDDDAQRRREMDRGHRGKGPRNYTRSDDRIKENVNERLSDSYYLDASDIDVSVENGEVTLSGNVDSRTAKRRAEDIADDVSGVNHTQNNLRVKKNNSESYSSNMSSSGTSSQTASSTTETATDKKNKSKSASS